MVESDIEINTAESSVITIAGTALILITISIFVIRKIEPWKKKDCKN